MTSDTSLDDAVVGVHVLHSFPESALLEPWRRFLLEVDYATHYVAPEYFLEPFVKGKSPFAILVMRGSRVAAVVTGMHDGKTVVCGVSGRPQLAFVPPFERDVQTALIEALRRESAGAELITITSWTELPGLLESGFVEREVDAIMTLDLTRGPEALLKDFNKGRRSDISFARRNGVEVRESRSDEDFLAYYEIYSDWCKRKAMEPQSLEVMRDAFALRGNRRLFMAFHEGKAIAGSVVRYVSSGVAEYTANNSVQSALALRPNSLLNWVAIQWACAEGLRVYSMGGSHPFLRHFGGTEVRVRRYRLDLTLLRRHDRMEWVTDKLRSVARAAREALRRHRGRTAPPK